jgi:hypothetical protein
LYFNQYDYQAKQDDWQFIKPAVPNVAVFVFVLSEIIQQFSAIKVISDQNGNQR